MPGLSRRDRGVAEPLIRPAQVSQLRQAAVVLRDLYDDGYIDCGLEEGATYIDKLLETYTGVGKV